MTKPLQESFGTWHVHKFIGPKYEYLGVWEGHVDEIALHLANQAGQYPLKFEPCAIRKPGAPTGEQVGVEFKDGLHEKTVASPAEELFRGRPVLVQRRYSGNSVHIVDARQELGRKLLKDAELRRGAYAVLTSEQLKALGLPQDIDAFKLIR